MYRMVVSDLDGTLLNSKKQISENTVSILKMLKEKHIHFIAASGRSDVMMKHYLNQLQYEQMVIGCDGALVKDVSTGNIIYGDIMDQEVRKKLFVICKEMGLQYYVFTSDALVGEDKYNERFVIHRKFNKTVPKEERIPILITKDLSQFLIEHPVYKIVVSHKKKGYLDQVAEIFKDTWNVDAIRSGKHVLAVKSRGVSKATALKKLTKIMGISMEEVIAFGDEVNDIEMLRTVGLGIAMGNTDSVVKNAANCVTSSNDADGVAEKLKELFEL